MSAPESTAAMPPMMYGTAWKKDRTADLVYEAIKAGFRGIDTAAMKKHYDEALTGEGIRRAIREGIVSRKDLFIQTKFTPLDLSSPYDPSSPIPAQIHASLASSLSNLTTTPGDDDAGRAYLDAVVLHSPFPTVAQTREAWTALQAYLPSSPDPARRGRVRRLGVSNVTLPVLRALQQEEGMVAVVQNRFRGAEREWDREIRRWVGERNRGRGEEEGVKYQGFWTLTGNAATWQTKGFVRELAEGSGVSLAAAWYVLIMEAGVVVLNGTGNREHMREDLDAQGKVAEWRRTENGKEMWERCWSEFRMLVDGD
ncbi:hypothetical protein VTI74DRAFT_9444 [Chaetomium olivicolor]